MKSAFSRLAVAIVAVLGLSGAAVAQTFPTDWYWQVADTNPTTQVWQSKSGAFVSNTTADFNAWLTLVAAQPLVYGGLAQTICNVTNNGSGHPRISVACPGNPGFSSGLTGRTMTITGVGGATGVNGAAVATWVDQFTIDMLTETFGGAYTSGGVIGAGAAMDTAANMAFAINRYNQSQYASAQSPYTPVSFSLVTSTTALSNSPAIVNGIVMGSGSQSVTLPQANLFGSMPIGIGFTFSNTSSFTWTLKSFGGSTLLTVPIDYSVIVTLTGNGSTAGNYIYVLVPNAQLACADLSNAAASCSTDTTAAGNISSGTLPAGRMPALTGDCTTSAGAVATTCTKINGVDQTTAWSTYTPTVTCGSGAITTYTSAGRYKQIGKSYLFNIFVSITSLRTCGTYLQFTIPTNVNSTGNSYALAAVDETAAAVVGSYVSAGLEAGVILGTPAAHNYVATGVYESP